MLAWGWIPGQAWDDVFMAFSGRINSCRGQDEMHLRFELMQETTGLPPIFPKNLEA